MQKTFDVFIKSRGNGFRICSKKIESDTDENFLIIQKDDDNINWGAPVHGCDVSKFLKTLGLKRGEVIEAKVTFKID